MALLPLLGCALRPHVIDPTVGVHYYPWYAREFHGGEYVRRHLVPPQRPALGEYSDRDPAVIAQHLAWSRAAGIDFWSCSWWGPGHETDVTLRDHILPHPDFGDMRFAILYETEGRTNGFTDWSNLGPDIAHLARTYFGHPNYLRVDGRPVIFVYLTRSLSHRGVLASCVDAMRRAAREEGFDLFIVGDQVFGRPPEEPGDLALLDAVFNYDVYGSLLSSRQRGQVSVRRFISHQAGWKALADEVGTDFVPSVTPGFNDRSTREGHVPMSRRLTPEAEEGSLFRAVLRGALRLTDPDIDHMLVITSWNEWHEDTQIEPVELAPPTSRDSTPSGDGFTQGVPHTGYGTLYLEILREEIDRP